MATQKKPKKKNTKTSASKNTIDDPQVIEFLRKYNHSVDEFEKSGIEWVKLQQIREKHTANRPNLLPIANMVLEMLRQVDGVHSLKMRIKDPEHLMEKVLRKSIEKANIDITKENYNHHITDLIGIRALHLFKSQWEPIHNFVTNTWEMHENPTAYVREGDSEEFMHHFKDKGCDVKIHPRGYRSLHYLLQVQPTKEPCFVELQVRTLFEEGWSEIDHLVQYPYQLDDSLLSQFLAIFNRLAGSADEMGTFIKLLGQTMQAQKQELNEKEEALTEAINQLGIAEEEKTKLQRQVKELSTSSAAKGFHPSYLSTSGIATITSPINTVLGADDVPVFGIGALLAKRTCTSCGEPIGEGFLAITGDPDQCSSCNAKSL